MGVINKILKFLFVLILISEKVFALSISKFKFLLNVLDQTGKDGKQVYDNSGVHDVSVIEPMLFITAKVDAETDISFMGAFDSWSAQSDTRLDGNSGASGAGITQQARGSGQLSFNKTKKSSAWSTRLGVSSEYDYQSLNFGGHWQQSFAKDNFTLSISPQLFLDQSKDYDLQNEQTTDWSSRVIGSINFSALQYLTKSDVMWFGYNPIIINGNLNSISNTVSVDSNPYNNEFSRVEEKMPTSRLRHALFTKWAHAWSETNATMINYRYYTDDWGLTGHTLELSQRLSFLEDDLFIMPQYRYYSQSSVDFYSDSFTDIQEHMTSDHDLQNFTAHRVGLHYGHALPWEKLFGFEIDESELSFGLYHYWRSNNLDYSIVQSSIGFMF